MVANLLKYNCQWNEQNTRKSARTHLKTFTNTYKDDCQKIYFVLCILQYTNKRTELKMSYVENVCYKLIE